MLLKQPVSAKLKNPQHVFQDLDYSNGSWNHFNEKSLKYQKDTEDIIYINFSFLTDIKKWQKLWKKLLSFTCYDVHLYLAGKRTAGEIKPAGDAFLFRFCFPRCGMMRKVVTLRNEAVSVKCKGAQVCLAASFPGELSTIQPGVKMTPRISFGSEKYLSTSIPGAGPGPRKSLSISLDSTQQAIWFRPLSTYQSSSS